MLIEGLLPNHLRKDGTIVGTNYSYELAQHGNGYVRKATGQNYVKFPASVFDDLRHRGALELWINPKVSQPVPYSYGVFGLVGAPYGHGGVPKKSNVHLRWGDTVTGTGLYGSIGFDGPYARTPDEPTQFVATPLTPFHAARCWDIDGIDGTTDKVRVYRDGVVVGIVRHPLGIQVEQRDMTLYLVMVQMQEVLTNLYPTTSKYGITQKLTILIGSMQNPSPNPRQSF